MLRVFSFYRRYVSILEWMTLVLFAYVATVLVVDVLWRQIDAGTLSPYRCRIEPPDSAETVSLHALCRLVLFRQRVDDNRDLGMVHRARRRPDLQYIRSALSLGWAGSPAARQRDSRGSKRPERALPVPVA